MINFSKIILLLIFFSGKIYSQEYWLKQPAIVSNNLRSCFFTDTLHGWIAGDSGMIIHTTDKGQSWKLQNAGLNNDIVSVFFINNELGFGLAQQFDNTPPDYYGSKILSTTDGGNKWNSYLFPDTNLFLNSIFFLDSLNGFMAGSGGKIFYTTNTGSSWIAGVIDSGLVFGFPIESIKFYDALTGYASGGAFDLAGVMWNSTNGGRTWRAKVVGAEPVHDFHMFDNLNILGVGGDFEYGASRITSTNGGNVWTYNEIGVFGIANSIGFRTGTECWAGLGIVDSFLFSTNSGHDWSLVGSPGKAKINDLIFIDSTHGWAVGKEGAILKFNSDVVSISNEDLHLPSSFFLYQNYPNPFNPSTIIRYSLNKNQFVTLQIFDINGKEIETLVNEKQNAGSYEVSFDTDSDRKESFISSGIYFYRITVTDADNGQYTESKRMIILK